MLEPTLPHFAAAADRCSWTPLRIPFVSSVDGRRYAPGECLDSDYWTRHLRQPVRFVDAARLVARSGSVLLEVGVGHTLTHLLQAAGPAAVCLPTVDTGAEDEVWDDAAGSVLSALGEAWAAGVPIDWSAARGGAARPRLVPLPAHPFKPTRHWVAGPRESAPAEPAPPAEARVVQPSTPVTATLDQVAALWSEVLGTQPRPEDNFFSLGGDSLALLGLVKRFRETFGVRVALRDAAGAADLRAMAGLVARAGEGRG